MGKYDKYKTLNKKVQQNVDNKDSGNFTSYIKIDKEKRFTPVEGINKIDIIPYEVATNKDPKNNKGDIAYILEVWTHKKVGAGNGRFICLQNTYNKPCPVCELLNSVKDEMEEDEYNEKKAKKRGIYNVYDRKKGSVKQFDESWYLFEKELLEELSESEEVFSFPHPEDGKTIKFRKTDKPGLGKYKSFSFEDRDEAISEDILDEAIPLDTLLVVPTYDEVKTALVGAVIVDDEDEDEEDDIDDEEEVEIEEEPVRKKKRVPVEEEPEEEEDDKDIEEEDEVEEEEKPARKKKTRANNECPYGHVYGKDCDEHADCDECEKWDDCAAKQEELEG